MSHIKSMSFIHTVDIVNVIDTGNCHDNVLNIICLWSTNHYSYLNFFSMYSGCRQDQMYACWDYEIDTRVLTISAKTFCKSWLWAFMFHLKEWMLISTFPKNYFFNNIDKSCFNVTEVTASPEYNFSSRNWKFE